MVYLYQVQMYFEQLCVPGHTLQYARIAPGSSFRRTSVLPFEEQHVHDKRRSTCMLILKISVYPDRSIWGILGAVECNGGIIFFSDDKFFI